MFPLRFDLKKYRPYTVLLNYADIKGGTWFPKGGMYSIVEAMYKLALGLGVKFCFNQDVTNIEIKDGLVSKVFTESADGSTSVYEGDVVIANADYHHIENKLLPSAYRNYPERYWDKKVLAPSCILFLCRPE